MIGIESHAYQNGALSQRVSPDQTRYENGDKASEVDMEAKGTN